MARRVESPPAYQVPALEKGLDILECLAGQGVPLTQSQLARALGRGPNEVFRMLVCLERRGYIQRDASSGAYSLTLRLFELSHTHSPYQGLLRAAARPMQRLTERVLESCHLSVIQRGKLLVLAQEESPRPLRLSVDVRVQVAPRPIGGLCSQALRFSRDGRAISLEELLLRHAQIEVRLP